MPNDTKNRIEKRIELKAPVTRVWKALTDHREFGEWFRVKVEAPFVVGQWSRAKNLYPGYEHLVMDMKIEAVEPERRFAYSWHPYAVDAKVDYSKEATTLVEFVLEPVAGGTLLRVTESGFDLVPAHRRAEAFKMHEGGWAEQLENIARHVSPKT